MTTRAEAIDYLRRLDISPFVMDLYLGKPLAHHLDIYSGCPEEFFMLSEPDQALYSHGHLMPVVDNGNFDYLTFHNPSTSHFVIMALEEPFTHRVDLPNWQSVLAELLFRVAESTDNDEEIIEIGEYAGLRNARLHLAFLDSLSNLEYEERDKQLGEYLALVRA